MMNTSRQLAVKRRPRSAALWLGGALYLGAAGCMPAAPQTTDPPPATSTDPNHWSGGSLRSAEGASAGDVSSNSKYKMVFTLGRPTDERKKSDSAGYQLQSVMSGDKGSDK